MDGVPGGEDGSRSDLLVSYGDSSPKVVEGPPLLSKVGEEREREAKRQVPLDRGDLGLLGYLIDGGERRLRSSDIPNRMGEQIQNIFIDGLGHIWTADALSVDTRPD